MLEKAGRRNPEVFKYEGFTYCFIYSWFVINIISHIINVSFKIPCQDIFVQFTTIGNIQQS